MTIFSYCFKYSVPSEIMVHIQLKSCNKRKTVVNIPVADTRRGFSGSDHQPYQTFVLIDSF